MAEEQNVTNVTGAETTAAADKGKGKEVSQEPVVEDTAMDEDEVDSSSDEGEENDNALEEEEDGLEEIDLKNIVEGGRRTRGRVIDFAKAAEENPPQDDEDEDDDDFKAPEEDQDVKMSTD
ncbi:hypothetical protein ACRALDRAFT_1071897 [Sodiomyces alcalophilus JCM 7366]|uniref:uncharacterized protein n=1 Tax=Sodiomyces alcalophilus JCM 7366 TaxID=591952 RepID=UPI0039B529E3